MKILYFTIQINDLGGLARIVIDKINRLVGMGYDVTLCNIESLEVRPYYPLDSRVKLVRGDMQTTPGGMLTRLKGTLATVKRLRQIIREENPDVIINAHTPLITWVLPFVCRDIPKIMEIHQSRQGLEVFNQKYLSPTAQWVHRHAIRWIYGKYRKLVVLTHGDQESWNLKNCIVIPNFSTYPVESENPNPLTSKNVICLARLMPQKRIDLLIEIWAKVAKDFPDWKCTVYGEGMYRLEYEAMAAKLGVGDSFRMPGAVPDVRKYIDDSSILCLTSEYEGFGIVLIEAQLKGVPVIAFEYVGVHDIIENGQDGWIVPFGDTDAYADKLREMMSSHEERLRLQQNAFRSVKKFDNKRVMKEWDSLFRSLHK